MTVQVPRRSKWNRGAIDPPRAVIDIGSNTVRLVIYEGPARSPETVWNEKVAARLGRDLATTGEIPDEAAEEALGSLARFELLIRDLGIDDVQTVATAAAREATNGPEFLAKVSALGLKPRLLSGEEEARASAMGTIGAFPGARGVVADLGGGSLELVSVDNGDCHHGESLPLGTLMLPALRRKSNFGKRVGKALGKVGWAQAHPGPLYMVGGTWRALASYAMKQADYPLTDPHGFCLELSEAERLCRKLVRANPEKLAGIGGISPMRAGYLPDAAALLKVMLDKLEPDQLVFSSWGLREGLLFQRLEPLQRQKDPLLSGVIAFAGPRDGSITEAAMLAGWSVDLANGRGKKNERLRLAVAVLSMALQRVEPNLRARHAVEWALDKRWVACTPRERAMICAALWGSLGRTEVPLNFLKLASENDLREGTTWGLGYRLARRLGAASRMSLTNTSLTRKKSRLILRIDESHEALANYPLTRDFEIIANWLDLKPKIEITSRDG